MSKLRIALLLSLATGCLLGRPPEPPRYFRPEPVDRDAPPTLSSGPKATLRLQRVTEASHLGERIVWRVSDVEFGFYDSRRWTERPAHYVEEALSRELFEIRGLRRARAGRHASLEVELLSFDEVLEPEHSARVELRVLLTDPEHLSLLERRYREEVSLEDDDPLMLSRAMGRALARLVQRVADDVEVALP
ncbi:MAG: ABC-type transport auxiliary lipoprotein family protein [Myxococcota bacterium]